MILLTGSVRCPHPKTQRLHIFYTNWGKLMLQIGAVLFITNQGGHYSKLGQLQYYKLGQMLLQIAATVIN